MQWTPGAVSLGIKWQGCEDDHSTHSGAKVMKTGACTVTTLFTFKQNELLSNL
jgi:hypothetical protein